MTRASLPGLSALETIGEQVDDMWSARGRDPTAFADIAERAIREQDLRAKLDGDELLRYLQTAPYLEQKGENQYGEPAITIVRKEGFRVEIIFWMDGVANIHGHAAEGAFFLLEGERLHATYDFERSSASTHGLLVGDLRLDGVELLVPGDLRKIYPGLRSIHSLVFIGRPCVTVSVRAVGGVDEPLYLHANDHVLMDVRVSRASIERRLSAFDFFVRLHPSERLTMGRRLLDTADILLAQTLLTALRPTIAEPAFAALLEAARARFGAWIDKVLTAAERKRRRQAIESAIPGCADRGPRTLLGLAWAGADRRMTLELLERQYPGEDPLALVDRWIVAIRGPRTPAEEFAASIGITPEDDLSAQLRALRRSIAKKA